VTGSIIQALAFSFARLDTLNTVTQQIWFVLKYLQQMSRLLSVEICYVIDYWWKVEHKVPVN